MLVLKWQISVIVPRSTLANFESIIPSVCVWSMTMSPSINYAEQVLREEAERLAKLKEDASVKQVKKETEIEDNLKTSMAKVNLKDKDDFPTLGTAKGTKYYLLMHALISFYSYQTSLEQFNCGPS